MVTLAWRAVQRARIVLYAAAGMQDIDIAGRLDCSPDSVARRRRRFCAERLGVLTIKRGLVDRAAFPPQQVAEVKVIACELPIKHDLRRASAAVIPLGITAV